MKAWLKKIADAIKALFHSTPAPVVPPVVTPPVTPPVVPPVVPPVTPVTGLIHASMFVPAAGCPLGSTINTGVSGSLAWAQCHGQSKENEYRDWLLDQLQAAGVDTMAYIVDGYLGDPATSVLAMCLSDMGHPSDGHHADQTEGWYTRCVAHGITRQIAILRDSPDTKVPATKDSVARLVAYYKNSRFDVVYLTGLECNRNRTAAQTIQDVKWLQELAPGKRIVAGSADPAYLLSVANGAPGVELWLEQPDSLMARPLTVDTIGTYCMSLNKLALKVGAGRVWAGEWWAVSAADRKQFTQTFKDAGYNICGGYTQ